MAEAKKSDAKVFVVIADKMFSTATGAATHEDDVVRLFVERVGRELDAQREDGVLIVDRPGGGRAHEDKTLERCLELLEKGTKWVKPRRIALNVLSSPSHCVRLLQLADLIAGCTLAAVAGESRYSPPLFAQIKEMLGKDGNRIGGIGLTLHPHFKYTNLYHWLVGDTHFWYMNRGVKLPIISRPCYHGPEVASLRLVVGQKTVRL